MTWRPVGPRKAEFSIRAAFDRNYPGSGPDGKLVTGDIFSESYSQAHLCFGDGVCSEPLTYEVTGYDATKGWFLARAVNIYNDQPSPGTGSSVSESEPNSSIATANHMNLGDDFLSTMSGYEDSDFVSFTLTQRTKVRIRSVLVTMPEGHLSLWSSSGEMLSSSYSGSSSTPPTLTTTLEPGTYFIRVGTWYYYSSGGTQRVELRQFDTHAPEPLTHTYPGNGPYTAKLSGCCRMYPYDVWVWSPVRFDLSNSSPVSNLPHIIEAPYNTTNFTFQIPAVDAEGDTLTFRTPTLSENPYTSFPFGLTISSSGLITWNTTNSYVGGMWLPQVIIEERRNGQLIGASTVSFTLRVVTATTTPPSCLVTPESTFSVNTGEQVQFRFSATDPDEGDSLLLSGTGIPSSATLSYPLPWYGGRSGDGTTFSWTPPSNTAGQTYSMDFMVKDAGGLTAHCPVTLHVLPRSPDLPPEAEAGPDQNVTEGDHVTLSGSAVLSEGRSATYEWSLLSGTGPEVTLSSPTSPTPTFVPTDDGVYTFLLTVTDSAGGSSTDTVTVTVNNAYPQGAYIADQTIEEGTVFSTSGSFSDPGSDTFTATVDYGDGSGEQPLVLDGTAFQLNHLYADSGYYSVEIRITDDDGAMGGASLHVQVTNIAPVLSASGGTVDEGSPFIAPVSFVDPSGTNWQAYIDYGDGWSEQLTLDSHGFNLNHVYPRQGTYEVHIILYDEDGGAAEAYVQVEVRNVAPSVSVTCTPSTLEEFSELSCSGTITDPGNDSQAVHIDYGDGRGDWLMVWMDWPSFTVNHTYESSGVFPVTITVTDEDGAQATTTLEVTVTNTLPGVTALGGTIDESSYFELYGSFTDTDWLGPWDITVDFGDGSGEQTGYSTYYPDFAFGHFYEDSGTYTVTIRVTDHNGGVGTATVQVVVNNVAPEVGASSYWAEYWGLPLYLVGSAFDRSHPDTEAGLTASWDLGDGTSISGLTPYPAVYANPGSYVAVLTVTDKDGASGTASTPVEVMKRPSGLSCADTSAVFGFPLTLSAQLMDALNLPAPKLGGRTLSFHVDPSTDASGLTTAEGLGGAQLPGTLAPGSYTVSVSLNGDSHYEDSFGTCMLTVTQSEGAITGSSLRFSDESQGGFTVSLDASGQLQGELEFVKGSTTFHSSTMHALGVAANKRSGWFAGMGDDGRSFLAYAERHSVPGTADTFKLWIDGELQTVDERLRGGFVRFP
ncbi:PKD domain-containing protein [Hyalangium versicolor]|uniref:PKD domain-containing protein n=1 Tax=Hyalangium versicolor TaxID=2861190 RepID=UPI001CCB1E81|nr:PKD domain-containing protein [Hyalangium versicolor]